MGRKEKNSDINPADQLGNGFFFNIVIAGIVSAFYSRDLVKKYIINKAPTHEILKTRG